MLLQSRFENDSTSSTAPQTKSGPQLILAGSFAQVIVQSLNCVIERDVESDRGALNRK